ncbi:MAG: cation transporter, partial [Clostridia bacterium]|nr:cation transporter [Clostridia bacterium]
MKSKYDISGMSCSACSARVEKSVGALDGVKEVNVNLISGVMTVEYDEQKVTEADMKKAVESGGYGMQRAKTFAEKKEQKKID